MNVYIHKNIHEKYVGWWLSVPLIVHFNPCSLKNMDCKEYIFMSMKGSAFMTCMHETSQISTKCTVSYYSVHVHVRS